MIRRPTRSKWTVTRFPYSTLFRATYEVLTNGLRPDTLQGLDDLLARRTGQAATWLSWLRNAPQSPAARNILRLIERLTHIRALDLYRARADIIPALRPEERRVGKECLRTCIVRWSPLHLKK